MKGEGEGWHRESKRHSEAAVKGWKKKNSIMYCPRCGSGTPLIRTNYPRGYVCSSCGSDFERRRNDEIGEYLGK